MSVKGLRRAAGQVLRLAVNDLRLTAKDRAALIWMLLLPLAFMWLFGQQRSSTTPKVALGIEDQDGGWLAQALRDELGDEKLSLVEMKKATPAEPEANSEPPPRTLVIPAGFTAGVLAGEQQTLQLEKQSDASEEFSLAAQMHIVRAIVRTIGRLVEVAAEGGGVAEDGAGTSGGEDPRAERFRALASRPSLVQLAVTTAGQGRRVPSGRAQSVPGMLTMIVLMMTLIYGGVFLANEKQGGVLRRLVAMPLSRGEILLGKLCGRLFVAGVQILLLLAAGRYLFGVSWGDSPLGLTLVLASYALAVAGLSLLLGALVATPEQAQGVGWLLSMVLAALGGCWWPSEVMPGWLWNAAHVLPTAWAMDAFHALISFGQGWPAVRLPVLALSGFGLLFTALAARWLRYE